MGGTAGGQPASLPGKDLWDPWKECPDESHSVPEPELPVTGETVGGLFSETEETSRSLTAPVLRSYMHVVAFHGQGHLKQEGLEKASMGIFIAHLSLPRHLADSD
jgi:hypothetical protein